MATLKPGAENLQKTERAELTNLSGSREELREYTEFFVGLSEFCKLNLSERK